MEKYEQYIGQVFDKRYQIVKVIGNGGMAVVFEAVDLAMNRTVAVKMLKEDMANDIQAVKRFINESQAVAMLSHRNIVPIYDVSVKDDLKYIVMERIHGITLKDYMKKKGNLSMQEILSYSEQILRALEHAHSKGIIHRDIKPQNVLLLKNGRVMVTDFGIAKLPSAQTVTMSDKAIGTVYYISPEQASGKTIDCRSDLYSLGVCMYEMATGQLPFNADSPVSVALMQVNDAPRRPCDIIPDLPVGLEQIILGAMEKDPNRRFQDAASMLHHIAQLRSDPQFVFRTKRVRRSEPNEDGTVTESRVLDTEAVKDTPMKKKKQSTSMFPIIVGAALAFLLVCVVCGYVLVASYLQKEKNEAPTVVQIPTFVGNIATDEYLERFDSALYDFQFEYISNDAYTSGTIVEQDPAAGNTRKVQAGVQKCTVTLTVSRPEATVFLPDVTYSEHRAVEQQLRALGLKVKEVKEYHDSVESGSVFRTVPSVGSEVKVGSTVTVYVSRGTQIENVVVPDFRHNSAGHAYEKMFDEEGKPILALGDVEYVYSQEVDEGCVISQSLEPYSAVVRGTKIDFVVSLGRNPNETDAPAETEETTESGEETGGEEPVETDPAAETEPKETEPKETEPKETVAPDYLF